MSSSFQFIRGQLIEIGRMVREFLGARQSDSLGGRGERAAERFLKQRKYKIVGRQMRNSMGEIDLIAVLDRTVVFVEVKTRSSDLRGSPSEAVDDAKQKRISKAALAYLKRHHMLEYRCRFDVIAITWPECQKKPVVTHFENAFQPTDQFQLF